MKALREAVAAFRSGDGLKGQLLRGGVGSIAIKIGSTLLALVLAVVLARTLGAEGYGVYSFVLAVVITISIPAQMGLPNLVIRETAKAQAGADWTLIRGLWRWGSVIALLMSLGLMVLGGVAAWAFAGSFAQDQLAVFYWGLVLVPLTALGNLRGAALRGLGHVVQGQLPEFVLRPAFLIVLVVGAHLGLSARALTASDAMMLHALASLLAFAIGAYLLLRARPTPLREQRISRTYSRLWLMSALPLGMIDGMHLINRTLGMIVLGFFASAEDVALYRVALLGAGLVGFAHIAIDKVLMPHFARLHAENNRVGLQKLTSHAARIDFVLALPTAVVFIAFGQSVLTFLFGQEYSDAHVALAILSVGGVTSVVAGPAGQLLQMGGREKDLLISVAASVLCLIVLMGPFALMWGIEGAATAGLVSRTVMAGLFAYFTRRSFGINSTIFARPRAANP